MQWSASGDVSRSLGLEIKVIFGMLTTMFLLASPLPLPPWLSLPLLLPLLLPLTPLMESS